MPIYEYECLRCRQRVSHFQRSMKTEAAPLCPKCPGSELRRLVSRFAVMRSVDDIVDDSDLASLESGDPQAVARWARRMGEELGEDLGPEFDGELDRLSAGEDAEGLDGAGGDDEDVDS